LKNIEFSGRQICDVAHGLIDTTENYTENSDVIGNDDDAIAP